MTDESRPQPATAMAAIESLGLTMASEFVPYSLSRNARSSPKLTDLSLNWTVTIHRGGRAILATDYTAGCAHSPAYQDIGTHRSQRRMSVDELDEIRRECETGRPANAMAWPEKIEPKIADVLHSLVSDADAIDHPTFESWASDLGYDADSRKAEATYRACLETALKLRAALGEDGLAKLREAFQDY